MASTHSLGFPRIGARRELKFALEAYWRGESSREALQQVGAELRSRHWQDQSGLDWVPVGDFSFYDQVLDMSFTLGNLPARVRGYDGDDLVNPHGCVPLPSTIFLYYKQRMFRYALCPNKLP